MASPVKPNAKQTPLPVPSGAQDAMLPGGNHIHGARSARFSSTTAMPGTKAGSFPGRPSKAQSRGTLRGHQGMPTDSKHPSTAQSRGKIKGARPMGGY